MKFWIALGLALSASYAYVIYEDTYKETVCVDHQTATIVSAGGRNVTVKKGDGTVVDINQPYPIIKSGELYCFKKEQIDKVRK